MSVGGIVGVVSVVREASLANLRPPFASENTAAVSHGARVASWRLQGRACEIADELRGAVPECDAGAEVLLLELGLVLSRLEIAAKFLDENGLLRPGKAGDVWPIVRFVSAWEGQAIKLLDKLGLTPQAKSGMRSEKATSDVLAAYLAGRDEEASS